MRTIPQRIQAAARMLAHKHKCDPTIRLSCEGGSDEHWQLFLRDTDEFPAWVFVWDEWASGKYRMERHPDSPIR